MDFSSFKEGDRVTLLARAQVYRRLCGCGLAEVLACVAQGRWYAISFMADYPSSPAVTLHLRIIFAVLASSLVLAISRVVLDLLRFAWSSPLCSPATGSGEAHRRLDEVPLFGPGWCFVAVIKYVQLLSPRRPGCGVIIPVPRCPLGVLTDLLTSFL
ncbi:hypothetical protein N665_0213s0015 [Sinapis alba]|nr:hypothetical protein N665_0213s0015 [Sinapis alba]